MKLGQQQNTSKGGEEKQLNYVTDDDLCLTFTQICETIFLLLFTLSNEREFLIMFSGFSFGVM
jgi:hypothetical protein